MSKAHVCVQPKKDIPPRHNPLPNNQLMCCEKLLHVPTTRVPREESKKIVGERREGATEEEVSRPERSKNKYFPASEPISRCRSGVRNPRQVMTPDVRHMDRQPSAVVAGAPTTLITGQMF